MQATQNLFVDDLLGDLPHAGFRQCCLPGGEAVTIAEIGVQEMPAGAKHASHLAQETLKVRVDVRGLDVDHRIEGFVGEGQVLGVAVHELEAGQLVPLPAEFDAGCVEV